MTVLKPNRGEAFALAGMNDDNFGGAPEENRALRELKKAYAMSKKTIEAEPDNPTYLDTYGWILYLQGKAADAKPVFKHAMLYGGKDSAVILDHYAEVLYALEEYDLAFVYWNLSLQKHDERIEGLEEKIRKRREAVKK